MEAWYGYHIGRRRNYSKNELEKYSNKDFNKKEQSNLPMSSSIVRTMGGTKVIFPNSFWVKWRISIEELKDVRISCLFKVGSMQKRSTSWKLLMFFESSFFRFIEHYMENTLEQFVVIKKIFKK